MTRTWLRSLLLLPLLAAPLVAADDEKGFVPLFDGKSLDGWTKVGGGATYHTEDGMIVGEVGPGANTFLRTNKLYHNFILKLDVKLDVPGNSGIQFRSHESDKGRVFGYQCEIDPSPRAWTAGLYDEGRRGWLYPLAGHPEAQKAFKLADWNHFVIEACGPHLRTWLNGVPCADLIDTADLEGFIALQVHAGKAGRIRWKDIQLKDLGKSAWSPLWDGKTLQGWSKIGGGEWMVEDGAIHGTMSKTEPKHGHLITKETYADFAVRLKFKSIKGNSGLYFRVEEGGGAGVKGFQAEIDPANDVGGLYETDGRAWVVKPKPEDVKSWLKPGEWNELSVVAWGKRIVVHVNGRKTAELTDDPGRPQGRISLQLHGGQDMDVWFKDIEILDLKGACRDPGEASR
jgi:hypothetical protein